MAIILRGILGGFSGKIANVVGTTWKGRAIMKALPLSVANPRTVGQVNQRNKFTGITQLASQLTLGWIQDLWNRFSGNISGYNEFIKRNIDFVSTAGVVNYASIIYSFGELKKVVDTPSGGGTTGTNDASIQWNGAVSGNQATDDIAYVTIIDETNDEVIAIDSSTIRQDALVNVTTSEEFSPSNTYRFVLTFKKADGTIVSDHFTDELELV